MTERHAPEQALKGRDEEGVAEMARFRDLTRGLLKVTPDQLREERERYERHAVAKKRGGKTS